MGGGAYIRCATNLLHSNVLRDAEVEDESRVCIKFYTNHDNYTRELAAIKVIHHENVIQVLDAFEGDDQVPGIPAIGVMEWGDYTLYEFALHQRPLSVNHTKSIVWDVMCGLEACFKANYIHGDLKPQNVMYFHVAYSSPRWKLIDFDAACPIGEMVERGTLDYCSPETVRREAAATSMDMFSVGRIIQWLASTSYSVWGDDPTDEEKEARLTSVEPLFVSESELPHAATRKLVIGLLNKNAIQRRTVAEMLNGSFLSGNLHTSHIKPREKVSVEEPRIITRFNPELYNLDPEHRVNHGIELNAKISTNQLACYWKAWDNDNARYPVVCKFYFRAPRFDREQMAVQKLPPHRHIILPKVMRLIDASANKRDPWYPYKIAALMYDDTPTTTLYDTMLQHPQRFQSKDRFAVLQSMVNALEVVHGLGLVHCNVHPRNIIFSDNRWQLGGFSSCRPKGEVMDELEFPYSPPELWTARSLPVNETFDMYALGVLLFHLKVFRTRYFENEWEEIWEYQTNVAVLNKLKGGRTRDVIMKLVTYDPTKRMTLQQLKQDLETRPASLPLWKRF